MNVLIGALKPDSGFASFSGVSCIEPAANPLFDAVSHTLGFVPQSMGLYDALTPAESLMLYGRLKGLEDADIRAKSARFMRALRFDEHAHSVTENLSGGTKRKVRMRRGERSKGRA
jgi:ABC-2 type transport system ATP-binding protein